MDIDASAVIVDQPGRPSRQDGGSGAPPAAMGDASRVRARETPLTPLLKELFLDEVANGAVVTDICRQIGMNRGSFYRWAAMDLQFYGEFSAAVKLGLHAQVDDIRTLSRDMTLSVEERKLRIETDWKLVSKRAAGTYADKMTVDANVAVRSLNLHFNGGDVQAAHSYADMMRGRPPG